MCCFVISAKYHVTVYCKKLLSYHRSPILGLELPNSLSSNRPLCKHPEPKFHPCHLHISPKVHTSGTCWKHYLLWNTPYHPELQTLHTRSPLRTFHSLLRDCRMWVLFHLVWIWAGHPSSSPGSSSHILVFLERKSVSSLFVWFVEILALSIWKLQL